MPTPACPLFRGLDPQAPVTRYRRHLPHWRQAGATYFVTFRLADSIPALVLLGWQEEDRAWLHARGIGWPLSDPRIQAAFSALPEADRLRFERHAARRLHMGLDCCQGSCLLRRAEAHSALSDTLLYFHGTRWQVGDFVVMPNHVHGLFQPLPGYELSDILGSVKGYASTLLSRQGLKTGKLWQQENYDRLVRDRGELRAWRSYIARNPQKARLAPGSYAYRRCDWLDDPEGPP